MKTLLIIGTFEALFLILLIISKRERRISDFFLGFIFFSFALTIGFTYIEIINAEHGYPYPWALNINWLFIFLHGPALWFYIQSLSIGGFRFRAVYLLHFVPFVAFFLVQYIAFFSLEPSHRIQLVINDAFQDWAYYKISVICIGISTLTYYIWGLKQIRDHRKHLKEHFSRIDNKDLQWLRILIIVSLVVYTVNVGIFNLDLLFDIAPYRVLQLFSSGFASVYILVLGWFGLQQGHVFQSHALPSSAETGNSTIGGVEKKDSAHRLFTGRLMKLMEEQKPYLDPEITLSKMATMLQVAPEYLSGILNKDLEHSFFDFINKSRIEAFKLECLAEENRHLSIMGIAYNCGFNSKAAFYRAFRKYEKSAPGEYMERLRKK